MNGPSNYDENAEVGRGSDDDNGIISRYANKEDVDAIAQNAISRLNANDEEEGESYGKNPTLGKFCHSRSAI